MLPPSNREEKLEQVVLFLKSFCRATHYFHHAQILSLSSNRWRALSGAKINQPCSSSASCHNLFLNSQVFLPDTTAPSSLPLSPTSTPCSSFASRMARPALTVSASHASSLLKTQAAHTTSILEFKGSNAGPHGAILLARLASPCLEFSLGRILLSSVGPRVAFNIVGTDRATSTRRPLSHCLSLSPPLRQW